MEETSARASEAVSTAKLTTRASLLAVLRPTDARTAVLTLGVVSALVAVAAVVKLALLVATQGNAGYLVYIPAVAAAGWYRGFLGGVLATLLGALVDVLFTASTLGLPWLDLASAELRLVAYITAGLAVAFVSHRLRTERDRARHEAAARNRALEEVAQAHREVERVIAMERRANELRDAFNGIVSHELRTPITAIYGGAKLLARRDRDVGEAARRELIEDLEAEADRLYRLVEDLLVIAKSERGTVDRTNEPLLLSRLATRVVRSERERWPLIKFEVDARTVSTAFGDDTYVEQIIRNLVSNAAKYSKAGSTVQVKVDETPEGVRMRVLDDGVGIEAEEAARLFELYYRSPATAPTVSGAGIGLYVCRVLVEAMGGRIWALPRARGGAEFGFVLQRGSEDEDDEIRWTTPPVRTAATEQRAEAGRVPETALSPAAARPAEQ